MYKLSDIYANYYRDYIDKDVRRFKLECKINNNIVNEVDISTISIEYDLLSGAEEYTIGNLAAAKLTMVVSNSIGIYETNKIDLTVKLRAQDIYGTEIWIPVPLGRFYVFEVSSTKLSKTIIAYDDLYKKELERIYESALEYPTTTHKVLSEICGLIDLSYNSSIPDIVINRPEIVTETIMNNEGNYETVLSESNKVCIGLTVGKTLSCIAGVLGGNFIVDGDQCLKLIKYPTTAAKSYDFTRYVSPVVGEATYNMNQISCTVYGGTVINVGFDSASSAMVIENQLMNRTMLLTLLDELNEIKYTQMSVKLKGDPTLQLGDLIETYEIDKNGNAINKQSLPILRMTFSYTGGCTNSIESPCRSVAEKTINYKGTISSRIDNLENSVTTTKNEVQELYDSLTALKTVKDNVEDMDIFLVNLTNTGTLSSNELNQFNSIYTKIKESNLVFENEYDLIYNNRYL